MKHRALQMAVAVAIVAGNSLMLARKAAAVTPECTYQTFQGVACPEMTGWDCAVHFPTCGQPIVSDCFVDTDIVECWWINP